MINVGVIVVTVSVGVVDASVVVTVVLVVIAIVVLVVVAVVIDVCLVGQVDKVVGTLDGTQKQSKPKYKSGNAPDPESLCCGHDPV